MAGPAAATIKRLFALSGNKCAYPRCAQPLVDNGVFVGEMCHIEGERANSARHNAAQSDDDRRAFENIILLCPTHHTVIDNDEGRYTAERLREMKRQHESRQTAPFSITNNLAVILSAFAAGSFVEAISDRLANAVIADGKTSKSNAGRSAGPAFHPLPIMRAICASCGPGKIIFHSMVQAYSDLEILFARIAISGGWQAARLDDESFEMLQLGDLHGEATLSILILHRHELAYKLAERIIGALLFVRGFVPVVRDRRRKDSFLMQGALVTIGRL
jgi:hypothetical protein